jgi:hypothetical protein
MRPDLPAASRRQAEDLKRVAGDIVEILERADVPALTAAEALVALADATERLSAVAEKLEVFDMPLIAGAP